MQFESYLYDPPYEKKPATSDLVLIISMIVMMLGILLWQNDYTIGVWIAFLALIGIFSHKYFKTGKKPYTGKALGELLLDEKGITLMKERFTTDQIEKMEVTYGYWKDRKKTDIEYVYLKQAGTENEISLVIGGKAYHYHFMLWNGNHQTDLEQVKQYFPKAKFKKVN